MAVRRGSAKVSGEAARERRRGQPADLPINQPFSGTFGNQRFSFAYERSTAPFGDRGEPTGASSASRAPRIHLGSGGQVIELGPTIPVNLARGGTQKGGDVRRRVFP